MPHLYFYRFLMIVDKFETICKTIGLDITYKTSDVIVASIPFRICDNTNYYRLCVYKNNKLFVYDQSGSIQCKNIPEFLKVLKNEVQILMSPTFSPFNCQDIFLKKFYKQYKSGIKKIELENDFM